MHPELTTTLADPRLGVVESVLKTEAVARGEPTTPFDDPAVRRDVAGEDATFINPGGRRAMTGMR